MILHPNSNPILSAKGLFRQFVQGQTLIPVLSKINFEVYANEKIAIIGASGSGKSTLLHLLGGLDSPNYGEISLLGQPLSSLNENKKTELRRNALGFIYQFHHLLPELSALDNVAMPLRIGQQSLAHARAQAQLMLEKIGLEQRMHHRPYALSGGERQRVAIARALIHQPACILADEPTGNLDNATANYVFDWMLSLNQMHATSLVMVTHNRYLAQRCDRIFCLENTELHLQNTTNTV